MADCDHGKAKNENQGKKSNIYSSRNNAKSVTNDRIVSKHAFYR